MSTDNFGSLGADFYIKTYNKGSTMSQADLDALVQYIQLTSTILAIGDFTPDEQQSVWMILERVDVNIVPGYTVTDNTDVTMTSGGVVTINSLPWSKITGKPVFFSGAYADLTGKPTLFDGDYNSLTNKPSLFDGNYNSLSNKPALFDGAYGSLSGKPNLATVATSGNYGDLTNRPDLSVYLPKSGGTLTGKLNAVQGSGTTGGYSFGGTEGGNDTGMFSNADGVLDFYANDVKIVTVTTDGVISTQAITLPADPTGNLEAATKQYVDNAVNSVSGGGSSFSGDYNDLVNTPAIPTSLSQLTNDAGYITTWGQADWNEQINESPSYIQNKPFIPTSLGDLGITAGSDGQVLTLNSSLTPVWATPSSGGGNPFDQSLNTDDVVTFDLLTVTDSAGIKNFFGERITNTYVNGTMYVGGNLTQTPVSILMGGAGPRNEWAFTPDGKLTLPRNQDQVTTTDPVLTIEGGANPKITSTDSSLMGPAEFGIQASNLNISGYNGNKVIISPDGGNILADQNLVLSSNNTGSTFDLTLDTNGNLTTPGNIYGPNNGSTLVLGQAIASNNAFVSIPSFADGGELLTIQNNFNSETGGIQVNTNGYLDLNGKSVNLTGTTQIVATVNGNQWYFDNTGVITLPAGGDIRDINGTSVLGGGTNTGDITFDGVKVIGAETNRGGGSIELVPNTGYYGTGQYLNIYPTMAQDAPHIHIAAGTGGDLILGDDDHYVDVNNQGHISIKTFDSATNNTRGWSFKTDGSFAINDNEVHIATNNWGIQVGGGVGATGVVYTAKQQDLASIRVHATIEGLEDGDTSGNHTQACDMMIVRRLSSGGVSTVDSVVYGVIYTGTGPLATLDAQWDATANRIEITATPTSTTNNVYVKIYATEVARGD